MTAWYGKEDGLLALALYVLLLIVYYFMGMIDAKYHLYFGVPVNLLFIGICVILVKLRRQSLSTIGMTKRNMRKSLLTGLIFGLIITLAMNVLPNILSGGKLVSTGQAVVNVFYYVFVIALMEEVVFRGFIQTRIYGLIKGDVPAVVITGILFYLMHLPFQMQANGMRIDVLNMIVLFIIHIVLNFLYRKYNTLAGPVVMHALLDYGGNLFR
jgi:membrane protease YdiL (CAAX protease family)